MLPPTLVRKTLSRCVNIIWSTGLIKSNLNRSQYCECLYARSGLLNVRYCKGVLLSNWTKATYTHCSVHYTLAWSVNTHTHTNKNSSLRWRKGHKISISRCMPPWKGHMGYFTGRQETLCTEWCLSSFINSGSGLKQGRQNKVIITVPVGFGAAVDRGRRCSRQMIPKAIDQRPS